MTFKKALLICFIFIGILFTTPLNLKSAQITHQPDVNFSIEIRRLQKLNAKFVQSTNPVDRYTYSNAMIDCTLKILEKLKETNDMYSVPSLLILTDEIKKPDSTSKTLLTP